MKTTTVQKGTTPGKVTWGNHSLDDPAEDADASLWLEEFVSMIGRSLEPGQGKGCRLEDVAGALRTASKVKAPFTEPKVHKLLAKVGVDCSEESPEDCPDATFNYNRSSNRWEMYVPKRNPQYWSRDVFHELWEILFWRCFHEIHWWRQWAEQKRIVCPHDVADEFAYQMLLPYQSVRIQVPRLNYDLWRVCDFYKVPPQLGFRAITSGTSFPVPFFHGLLWLDAEAPPQDQTSLLAEISPELVHTELRKRAFKPSKTPSDETPAIDGPGVERLRKMPKEGTIFPHAPDDPVYQACRTLEGMSLETDCVFGYQTGEPVALVLRLSPQNSRSVYLQAVPPKYVEMLLPESYVYGMTAVTELSEGWLDA